MIEPGPANLGVNDVSGMMDKLKKAAGKNSDKLAEGVDKAKKVAKDKTGGKYDEKIDKAGDTASDYLRKQGDQGEQGGGRSGNA